MVQRGAGEGWIPLPPYPRGPSYLQRVDREGADGREVEDLEVVHVAVHDDSRQVEAAGGGGHTDLAELVVQELAHDGTLAHASRPQHGHPVGGDHASRPTPPPRPRRCLGLPRAAYSRGWGLSHRQDQSLLPLPALGPSAASTWTVGTRGGLALGSLLKRFQPLRMPSLAQNLYLIY